MHWFFSPPFREGLGVGFCILIADLRAGIGGTIVYEDDLIVVVILCKEAIYAFAEILLYSVYWNDDRQLHGNELMFKELIWSVVSQ
jgi:hypothetical protein